MEEKTANVCSPLNEGRAQDCSSWRFQGGESGGDLDETERLSAERKQRAHLWIWDVGKMRRRVSASCTQAEPG